MDAELIVACATAPEARAARRAGLRAAIIGLGGHGGIPEDGGLVSFGLCGGLTDEVACGDVIDATSVLDETGSVLWQGGPLGIPNGRPGTILAAHRIVDAPGERRRLHELTGADVADLESGPLARTGRLAACVRVVSDTPARSLHGLDAAVTRDGSVSWPGLGRAFASDPGGALRAVVDARRAMRTLRRVAEAMA